MCGFEFVYRYRRIFGSYMINIVHISKKHMQVDLEIVFRDDIDLDTLENHCFGVYEYDGVGEGSF